jgi:spore maturation protein CgeB
VTSLRILFVGPLAVGGTCLQRRDAMRVLGHEVSAIDTQPPSPAQFRRRTWYRVKGKLFRLGYHRIGPVDCGLPDYAGANAAILGRLRKQPVDILWLEKALTIEPDTLLQAKAMQPDLQIVGYSPDDMAGRHNQSRQFLAHLRYYDHYFTTKPVGVAELEQLGCPRVHLVGNAFAPHLHRPMEISAADRQRLGGPVGFVGAFERERAEAMAFLARNGVRVRVWGGGWRRALRPVPGLILEDRWLWGEDYARALCSFDINLGFLRRLNRDVITTRSIEIPACGAFMLAERTAMHQAHFEEGKEAEFFDSREELLEKVRCYLAHPDERRRIAAAGRERCLRSGYSNNDRIRSMLAIVMSAPSRSGPAATAGSARHAAEA